MCKDGGGLIYLAYIFQVGLAEFFCFYIWSLYIWPAIGGQILAYILFEKLIYLARRRLKFFAYIFGFLDF